MIRCEPELAMIRFPENYFFRLAMLKGSYDLYECYIEEAIEPFINGMKTDKAREYYQQLFSLGLKIQGTFMQKMVRCVKGMDFNSAFELPEKNENVQLIYREDFEVLDDVVENYNKIIGWRDILQDLGKRAGMK